MFHNAELERLTSDKHSNLLGQFLSYNENEVLWIRTLIGILYGKESTVNRAPGGSTYPS